MYDQTQIGVKSAIAIKPPPIIFKMVVDSQSIGDGMMRSDEKLSEDTLMGMTAMSEFTGIAPRRLHYLLSQGNIPGAFRIGRSWAMLKSVYAAEILTRATRRVAS